MKLKLLLSAAIIAATTITASAVAGEGDISVLVNNQPVVSEAKPIIISGTTLFQLIFFQISLNA